MNFSQLVPIIRRFHPGCKIFLYMQCEWLSQLDRTAMAERMKAADLIGGCSEYITRLIGDRFPEHRARCVTLNNASAAPEATDAVADPNRVLFVGRVSPEKGVHVLVEAFHTVLSRFPEARLHIVGGPGSPPLDFLVGLSDDPLVAGLRRFYEGPDDGRGPYMGHLERAAGAELGRRIIFEGRVDHDQTAAAYRRAGLLVNPSLSESFGMTLVEAMMHGVPVVATRIGGMPYIVNDEETGLVVPAGDPQSLAAAICRVLSDRQAATRMGDAGRRRALERFSWDRTAETLMRQLASVVV
jgi:glycosyltransferase involved in cell wall biosynthesis